MESITSIDPTWAKKVAFRRMPTRATSESCGECCDMVQRQGYEAAVGPEPAIGHQQGSRAGGPYTNAVASMRAVYRTTVARSPKKK